MENVNRLACKSKNMKITIMTSVMGCFLGAEHPALALNASWQNDAESAHSALEKGNPKLAGHFLVSALSKARRAKLHETDAAYRQLVFEFVSDDVLALCAGSSYAEAESVAKRKLSSAETLFGPTSLSAIDAMHDMVIIYCVSKRHELERSTIAEMNRRIKEAIPRDRDSENEFARIAIAKCDRFWAKVGPALATTLRNM